MKCRDLFKIGVLVVFISLLASIILAPLAASSALAEEKKGGGDLATQATNPAAALIQLQLQDAFFPSNHNAEGVANNFIVQPVYPFVLGPNHYFQSIITRTTVPVVTTADAPRVGRKTGLGDTTILAVPVRKIDGRDGEFFQWGPIGATTIPTATSDHTGSGQWSLGPGFLALNNTTKIFNTGDSLLVGGFGYHQFSVVGDDDRAEFNKTFFAPVVVYKYDTLFGQKGWYSGLPDDLWSYDFSEGRWDLMPVGLRHGRVFAIGNQHVNVFLQSWHNFASDVGAETAIKLNFTFLFPE